MNGWFEFGKLLVTFLCGIGLIWLKEAIAAHLDRKRKREALWRACETETPGAHGDFENIDVLTEKMEQGRPVGGVFHTTMTGARLAEKLLELDPANASAYLPYIIRTEQAAQRAADMKALFSAHAAMKPEERMAQAAPMVSELFFSARAMAWLFSDRLRILRVLRESMPNDVYAGSFIAEVEQVDREMREKIKTWEEEREKFLSGRRPRFPR